MKSDFTINNTLGINDNLSVLFVNIYNENKREGKNYIPFTFVAKVVMLQLYKKFVDQKLIEPIESLSTEEKTKLVDECKLDGGQYTNETLTQKCKILYLIQQINNYS